MSTPRVIAQLNERLGIAGAVRFDLGNGGLIRAVLTREGAEAHTYSHGAHVTHYQPAGGQPVLFVSEKSHFESGKAIRGGVPICFPWFAQHPDRPDLPMHGLARQTGWKIHNTHDDGSAVSITYVLRDNARTQQLWPHAFVATYTVALGDALTMTLTIKHRGRRDDPPFDFEAALHTYFSVADVRHITIDGLRGATYIDKTNAFTRKVDSDEAVRITRETDRVYLDTQSTCVVNDAAPGSGHGESSARRIVVSKSGSNATVVWNPWIAKAKAMADFGDDEWPHMVCVETCNVGDHRVTLQPGESHEMIATLRTDHLIT